MPVYEHSSGGSWKDLFIEPSMQLICSFRYTQSTQQSASLNLSRLLLGHVRSPDLPMNSFTYSNVLRILWQVQ
jgi:hypothetical protein